MSAPFQPVVLDTNALSALFDSKKSEHADAVAAMHRLLGARTESTVDSHEPLFIIPSLVVYEVKRGLLKRNNWRLLHYVERILEQYADIEPFDEDVAEIAAKTWVHRSQIGRPAGELDLLISATAVSVGYDIVTADGGFPDADDVRTLRWDSVQR